MEKPKLHLLEKTLTGIQGIDEITEGGLPTGRPTLVVGGVGSGKTLLGMEFLINGILKFNEPGVFIAFEETEEEIAQNVVSLGFDVKKLIKQNKLRIDSITFGDEKLQETPGYNLEGLFIRLETAIKEVNAKRVVIDTLEVLFANLRNDAIIRTELQRLFRWLKDKKVTAVVTGERGLTTLTRYGLEEYVADCVMFLDHRIINEISTRRFRILKYRGTTHGTNEYPFSITETGFSVMPITSLSLTYPVSKAFVSSGIADIDELLGGSGFYRGSNVLVSGPAGSGKTSIAAAFIEAACERGERCVYFALEESINQITRNMHSININLEKWLKKGLLIFHAVRPSAYGLETHLLAIQEAITKFKPKVIVIDPIDNLIVVGSNTEVRAMLSRLLHFFKANQITSVFTNLTGSKAIDETKIGISSLMDTWLVLDNQKNHHRLIPRLYVYKSRGMAHSRQICQLIMDKNGLHLQEFNLRQ